MRRGKETQDTRWARRRTSIYIYATPIAVEVNNARSLPSFDPTLALNSLFGGIHRRRGHCRASNTWVQPTLAL